MGPEGKLCWNSLRSSEGLQGSLNYPFWGNQTMQTYGNFEGYSMI